MVQKPIVVLPFVWRLAPNALCQLLQNLTVKLATDSFTRVYKFLMDNALGVEKNYQHGHDIAANLRRFFGRGEFDDFHCDDCCLVPGS